MSTVRTVINAIAGAVVGVLLSFIPFSTVLGGAVAGFLEGPSLRAGAIVGALAGVITFLPIVGIAIGVLGFLGIGIGVGAAPVDGAAMVVLFVLVAAFFVFVYTVGLALLGGYLGAVLAREYPDQHRRTLETIGLSRPTEAAAIDPTQPPQSSTASRRGGESTPRRESDSDSGPESGRESDSDGR